MIKRRKRWTTLEIIEEFKRVHGNKYNYSEFVYKTMHTKGSIICSTHGVFQQIPNAHIRQKQGCPKCGILNHPQLQPDSTESFISKARAIHGDLFDYSKTIYGANAHEKVMITCKHHGDILVSPNSHLSKKTGCLICANLSGGWTKERWVTACGDSQAKLYLIHCFNETESFYKIGATFKNLDDRLNYQSRLPYKFSILNIIEDTPEIIYDLERELQLRFYSQRYKPNIWFDGHTECFKPIPEITDAYASIH